MDVRSIGSGAGPRAFGPLWCGGAVAQVVLVVVRVVVLGGGARSWCSPGRTCRHGLASHLGGVGEDGLERRGGAAPDRGAEAEGGQLDTGAAGVGRQDARAQLSLDGGARRSSR
jgi:hypothetical protein